MTTTTTSAPALRDKMRYHFDRLATRAGHVIHDLKATGEDAARVLLDPSVPLHVGNTVAVLSCVRAHEAAGRQVFELGRELLGLFERTDFGSLKADQMKMPYPAIYLHLEGSTATIEREDKGDHVQLTGIYVQEVKSMDIWIVGLIGASDPVDTALTFPFDVGTWREDGLGFDAFVEKHISLGILKEASAAPYLNSLRIVMHTLLYLSSPRAELERVEDRQRTRLEEQAKRFEGSRRGRDADQAIDEEWTRARVTRIYPQAEREGRATLAQIASGLSPRVHWVRGHWNYYWVGAHGSPERRLEPRWIQPHLRGEGEPEQDARTYKLAGGGA
jgi:hypothetical protein